MCGLYETLPTPFTTQRTPVSRKAAEWSAVRFLFDPEVCSDILVLQDQYSPILHEIDLIMR